LLNNNKAGGPKRSAGFAVLQKPGHPRVVGGSSLSQEACLNRVLALTFRTVKRHISSVTWKIIRPTSTARSVCWQNSRGDSDSGFFW